MSVRNLLVGRRWSTVGATLATMVVGLALFLAASPQPANAAKCHTATSNIKKRKNISCKQARKIVRKLHRKVRTQPECRGQSTRAYGWKVRGIDKNGPVKSKWKKGKRSFVLVGGGWCR